MEIERATRAEGAILPVLTADPNDTLPSHHETAA